MLQREQKGDPNTTPMPRVKMSDEVKVPYAIVVGKRGRRASTIAGIDSRRFLAVPESACPLLND
jgi:hypothetical protein